MVSGCLVLFSFENAFFIIGSLCISSSKLGLPQWFEKKKVGTLVQRLKGSSADRPHLVCQTRGSAANDPLPTLAPELIICVTWGK